MEENAVVTSVNILNGISFTHVLIGIAIYLIAIWLMVSIWAGRDARRRYQDNTKGLFWGAAIFLLNFPALMFYLIIRPEVDAYHGSNGGLQVPLINFVGRDKKMVFNLQLKINPEELTEAAQDMKVEIDWLSNDPQKAIVAETVVAEAKEVSEKITGLEKLLQNFKKQVEKVKLAAAAKSSKLTKPASEEPLVQPIAQSTDQLDDQSAATTDTIDNNSNEGAENPALAVVNGLKKGAKKFKRKR